ncbi:MAG TPA: DUF6457 domain-containing protein [Mycobacteriales bacterium]|nr:DUF6457 domain-containing protein [Mycobacteriales bacterium]
METAEWLPAVAEMIGVAAPADQATLLDLTREIAHAVERPAGPLTLFMLGCAVGGGADIGDLIAQVRARLPA